MKRLYIFITAMLLTALTVSAQQISREVATQKAIAFARKANPQVKQVLTLAYKAEKPAANALAPKDDAYFYVFNRGFNQGFVIVSGDERTKEILGYCDHGTFDLKDVPPGLMYFLGEYANQIKYLQENNIKPIPAKASSNKTDVGTLLKAKWDQGNPYNYYLSGNVTGCVATALAQVMHYWQWPKEATTTIPAYYVSGNRLSGSALEPTTFDWSKMQNTYNVGDYSDGHEVAKLMKYVGHAVKMQYNTSSNGGSGAYVKDIINAMTNYFGYPKDEQLLYRTGLTATQWADTIYNNLAQGIPVIMCGSNSGGGHCFVCDGYNSSNGKYHINWGWGGSCNGDYELEVLAPSDLGTGASGSGGYTGSRSIVTRIHNPNMEIPQTPESEIPLTANYIRLMAGNQALTRDSRTGYVSGDLRYDLYASTNIEDSTQIDTLLTALGVYDESDNLINVINSRYSFFDISGGYYSGSISSFGAEYPYGSYKIYPVWGDLELGQWRKINGSTNLYIQADVNEDGKNVTFTPSRAITVQVNETSSGSGTRKTYKQTMTVTNVGKEEFSGELVIWVIGSRYVVPFDEIVDLPAGATNTYTITDYIGTISNGSIVNTGKQSINSLLLLVGFDSYLSDALWENISSSSNYGDIVSVYNFDAESPWSGTFHLGNNLKFNVDMVNFGSKASSQNVTVSLHPKGKITTPISKTQSVAIDKFSRKTAEFEFPNLTYGTQYDVHITYNSLGSQTTDTLSNYGYNITPVKGAIVYGNEATYLMLDDSVATWRTIPEDAYFVDASNSEKAASLVPGTNPNTLFLLAEGSAVPTSLEGKNVIIGTNCAELNIDDDYEFYSVVDFTATKANYRRTFAVGNDGTTANWETLLLPFDVSSVTKDDGATKLSWFTDNTQHGKNFWAYRFASEDDDNTVVFDFPESSSMLAGNTPYIITVPTQSTKWADKWVLTGKELTFTGENVSIPATDKGVTTHGADKKFDFVGRTYAAERNQIYYLNETGTRFENTHTAWASIKPYRCYFVGYFNNDALTMNIRIGDGDTTPTGISQTLADDAAPTASAPTVYTLDGKAVGTDVKQLPVGTYVTKGKKFMVNKFTPTFPKLK